MEEKAEKLFQLCTVWVYPSCRFSPICRHNWEPAAVRLAKCPQWAVNYGEQECCLLCSGKGELLEIKCGLGIYWPSLTRTLWAFFKDSFSMVPSYQEQRKLHSLLATCKRRLARVVLKCLFCTAMLTHSPTVCKNVQELLGVQNVMAEKKKPLEQL